MSNAEKTLRADVEQLISGLSIEQLKILKLYLNSVLATQFVDKQKTDSTPRKVLYKGKWLTEKTVMLLSGRRSNDTVEERNEKTWEYIKEKYK